MSIEIKIEKANIEDLLVNELFQKPSETFKEYWEGSDEELYVFYKKHNIDYNFSFNTIEELHKKSNDYLKDLMNAVKNDVSKWDLRLRASLTPKNLDISSDDYMKITFDTSEEDDFKIASNFMNAKSRSLIDFRSFEDNKLTLVYNRRGIFDEGSRIAIVKSKASVTFKDNFAVAGDNNFILSGILKEFNKQNIAYDFHYNQLAGDSVRVRTITAAEIIEDKNIVEQKITEAQKTIEIKEVAKKEVQQQAATTRQSLNYDSNTGEILKEANTEIVVNVKPLEKAKEVEDTKVIIKEMTNESLNDYAQKEIEKLKLRLAKAEDDGKVAYLELKNKINEGMSISDSLNYIKQKYREDHTVNVASLHLSQDLLGVAALEKLVDKKDIEIVKLENEIKDKENTISKREDTISSLKSTLQTKENELRLSTEKHQRDIDYVTEHSEKVIDDITKTFEIEIVKLKEDLQQNDELIIRLSEQNKINEKSLNEQYNHIKSKDEEIIKLKSLLQAQENEIKSKEELNQKIRDLEIKLQEKDKYIDERLKVFEVSSQKVLDILIKTDIISDKNEVKKEESLEDILKATRRQK